MTEALDLHLTGIAKSFGAHRVLQGLDLHVPDGQFTTLLGPSGCGKTTLLRIVAGFEVPDAGTVRLGSKDITRLPAHRRPVNTVFQSYALFPHLNVFDNVAFGLRARKLAETDISGKVAEMLEVLRIADLRHRKPGVLSGGQRQRVALARALVNEPEVLLLDEPMSALDARLRREVQAELKRIQRRFAITFILVTHDQDEAIAVSDRILIMKDGRIEQDGTPEQVYERPVSRFVAEFMGSANVLSAKALGGGVVATSVGELNVSERPAWNDGTVAIRPEDIEIREQQPAVNGLTGTVLDRLFRGDHWEVIVRVQDRELHVITEPDQHHAIDQAVWLELPPDDLLVLKD